MGVDTVTDTNVLLVDIGNTNLKWSWLKSGRRRPVEMSPYRQDDVLAAVSQYWGNAEPPQRILIASVAGEKIIQEITQWSLDHWGLKPEFLISQGAAWGVTNGYQEPQRLGVDRWLTLVALRQQEQGAVCVVDCGTAITIDVMDARGCHLGGLILPGFVMMREGLLGSTQLPPNPESKYAGLLALNTADAISAGSVQATAALIERVVTETGRKLDAPPRVVLTGSDAPRLTNALNIEFEIDRELIMRGLAVIAQRESHT